MPAESGSCTAITMSGWRAADRAPIDRRPRRKPFLPRQFSVQSCSSGSSNLYSGPLQKQYSVQSIRSTSSSTPVNFHSEECFAAPSYHLVDEPLPPSPHHVAAASFDECHSVEKLESRFKQRFHGENFKLRIIY